MMRPTDQPANGADDENRTRNRPLTRRVLCRLSYVGKKGSCAFGQEKRPPSSPLSRQIIPKGICACKVLAIKLLPEARSARWQSLSGIATSVKQILLVIAFFIVDSTAKRALLTPRRKVAKIFKVYFFFLHYPKHKNEERVLELSFSLSLGVFALRFSVFAVESLLSLHEFVCQFHERQAGFSFRIGFTQMGEGHTGHLARNIVCIFVGSFARQDLRQARHLGG